MNIKEWNEVKKNLKKLPIEQELRLLHASLAKVKDKEVEEKVKQEIKELEKQRDELKEWKKAGTTPAPQPSRLLELAEREQQPQERREQQSPLEKTVTREPIPQQTEGPKPVEYLSGSKQEYKSASYESLAWKAESMYIKPELTEQQQRQTEQHRFATETDRLRDQSDPMKTIETYKKKKDSR
ncbi:MAG: hypothetical protein AABX72_02705 [Nanoarchaeota archaeon]